MVELKHGQQAIGDRGQAAMSLVPGVDGTYVHIFESLQLEGCNM